jgi:hypothetical protein
MTSNGYFHAKKVKYKEKDCMTRLYLTHILTEWIAKKKLKKKIQTSNCC